MLVFVPLERARRPRHVDIIADAMASLQLSLAISTSARRPVDGPVGPVSWATYDGQPRCSRILLVAFRVTDQIGVATVTYRPRLADRPKRLQPRSYPARHTILLGRHTPP